jgi:hypothetical protein
MRYTTCNDKLTATKVPRQFPFVRLVKLGKRGGKKFGNEVGRDEKWGKKEIEQGLTALS